MPPEAFDGKADARSDIYALGLTLFELVALRPAYEERDRNKLIKQVTTGDPPRLRKLRRDAPPGPDHGRREGDRPRPGPAVPDRRCAGRRPAVLSGRPADPGAAADASRAVRALGTAQPR